MILLRITTPTVLLVLGNKYPEIRVVNLRCARIFWHKCLRIPISRYPLPGTSICEGAPSRPVGRLSSSARRPSDYHPWRAARAPLVLLLFFTLIFYFYFCFFSLNLSTSICLIDQYCVLAGDGVHPVQDGAKAVRPVQRRASSVVLTPSWTDGTTRISAQNRVDCEMYHIIISAGDGL